MIEVESIGAYLEAIVMKSQDNAGKFLLANFRARTMQQELVLLPGEKIAPQTFLITDDKIGVVAVACPAERGGFFEPDSLLAENNFPAFKDKPEQCVTQGG